MKGYSYHRIMEIDEDGICWEILDIEDPPTLFDHEQSSWGMPDIQYYPFEFFDEEVPIWH